MLGLKRSRRRETASDIELVVQSFEKLTYEATYSTKPDISYHVVKMDAMLC
jgi:hypothetical protein